MTARYIVITLLLLIAGSVALDAQRRITPVEPRAGTLGMPIQKDDSKQDRSAVVERMDANGQTVLVDTITGKEWVDSTAVEDKPKNKYPLLHAVDFGVNIWDPVMRMFGQHYGLFDIWAELSLHNRFKPVIEVGLGQCDDTPDGMNYTFKSKMAPYFKIGMNYNIFYNSDSDYQFNIGVRYGYSSFSYEVKDVTVDEGYWNEPSYFSLPSQSTSAGYFEAVFGIKVMVIKPVSLGWSLRYHTLIHEGKSSYGSPMYIPGFGKRDNALTGTFSIIYTLPLNKKNPDPIDTEEENKSD